MSAERGHPGIDDAQVATKAEKKPGWKTAAKGKRRAA